jgi:hypothetical protein
MYKLVKKNTTFLLQLISRNYSNKNKDFMQKSVIKELTKYPIADLKRKREDVTFKNLFFLHRDENDIKNIKDAEKALIKREVSKGDSYGNSSGLLKKKGNQVISLKKINPNFYLSQGFIKDNLEYLKNNYISMVENNMVLNNGLELENEVPSENIGEIEASFNMNFYKIYHQELLSLISVVLKTENVLLEFPFTEGERKDLQEICESYEIDEYYHRNRGEIMEKFNFNGDVKEKYNNVSKRRIKDDGDVIKDAMVILHKNKEKIPTDNYHTLRSVLDANIYKNLNSRLKSITSEDITKEFQIVDPSAKKFSETDYYKYLEQFQITDTAFTDLQEDIEKLNKNRDKIVSEHVLGKNIF